jgi:hypothetical protein
MLFLSLKISAYVGILLLLAGISAAPALADEFSLVPSVSLDGEYNDNILFSAVAPQRSFKSTLSSHLTLNERTERLTALLDAGFNYVSYSAGHDMDSLAQAYRGELKYRLTPTLNLQATAGFQRDSQPDRFVETTGLVTTLESDSQSYNAAADITLTEKLGSKLAYGYQQVDYRSSSVSGVRVHSITFSLLYDLTTVVPLLKLRTNLNYSTSRYTMAVVDSYSTTLGFSYPLNELWEIQAEAGGRYTLSTFDTLVFSPLTGIASAQQTNEDIGWVASMQLNYRGEMNTTTLGLIRNVQNAAGTSGSSEMTAVTLEVGHRFSYELSGSLSAGYYLNSSSSGQFSSQAIDVTTYRIRPALRYEFSRDSALDCAYEFGIVQNQQVAQGYARRNKVNLRLSTKHALFE